MRDYLIAAIIPIFSVVLGLAGVNWLYTVNVEDMREEQVQRICKDADQMPICR